MITFDGSSPTEMARKRKKRKKASVVRNKPDPKDPLSELRDITLHVHPHDKGWVVRDHGNKKRPYRVIQGFGPEHQEMAIEWCINWGRRLNKDEVVILVHEITGHVYRIPYSKE